MKILIIASILMFSADFVFSQVPGNRPSIDMPHSEGRERGLARATDTQNLFIEYKEKHRGKGMEARKILDQIYAQGLLRSEDNVKSIRSLLSEKLTTEEKAGLARILGWFYTPDNKTGMNNFITQDLRSLIRNPNKEIVQAAMLTYSRLGYFPDTEELLLHSKEIGALDNDGYYGELAHALVFSPSYAQMQIISKIKNGNNQYAREILAFLPNNTNSTNQLYPEAKRALLSLLQENEPNFGLEYGLFSVIDAVRYTTWLHSVATLSNATTNKKYSDVILSYLNRENTDPRKIMSFLISTEGKIFIKELGRPELFANAKKRVVLHSNQNPQNAMMRDAVQEISTAIDNSKQ